MAEIVKDFKVWVVCPMRSHAKTVELIYSNGEIPETYLRRMHETKLDELAKLERTFGIVAGTGVGKTVFLRDIARRQFGENFTYSVVTSEEQATDETWKSNVLIVTTGIAMNYLKAGYISENDVIIIDEVHQTSVHMELVMALARQKGIRVNFMSATIDPQIYVDYFNTETVLACAERDPDKRANVEVIKFKRTRYGDGISTNVDWIEYIFDFNYYGLMDKVIDERLGVAVFLPTREMCETFAAKYDGYADKLYTDFYHGGEKAEKLKKFIKGEVPRPFVIFMTPAGASSLNISGLNCVIMQDDIYKEVSEYGVRSLTKTFLENNDILQMAGRVDGRVKNSRVIIMSSRDVNYEDLRPETPNFVLSGDPETLALTCAHQRIDLTELDPIGGVNHVEYKKAWDMLVERELITPDNRLTEYGEQVHRLPVSRPWGEYLVNALGDPLFYVIMICGACPSLYNFLKKTSYNLKGLSVPGNDYLTKYNIIKLAIEQFSKIWKDNETGETTLRLNKEFSEWAKERGIYRKTVDNALLAISAICRNLNILLPELKSNLPAVDEKLEKKFKFFMLEIDAFEICNQVGRMRNRQSVKVSESSMCYRQSGPSCGQINVIRTAKGEYVNIFEGFCLDGYDAMPFIESKRSGGISLCQNGEMSTINWICSGFGFEEFITIKAEYAELPEPFASDPREISLAERTLVGHLSSSSIWIPDDVLENNLEIIEKILDNKRKTGSWFDLVDVTTMCYEKILRGSGVYNLTIAKKKNFSLKLEEKDFEEELKEPEATPQEVKRYFSTPSCVDNVQSSKTVTILDGVLKRAAELKKKLPKSIVMRADQMNRQPEAMYKHQRSQVDILTKALDKELRKMKNPPVVQAVQPAAPVVKTNGEPKGQTQERVDWLMAKEEVVRQEIGKIQAERKAKQIEADMLGAKYSELFNNKKPYFNELGEWQKKNKELEATDKKIKNKQREADALATEALRIMEVLN